MVNKYPAWKYLVLVVLIVLGLLYSAPNIYGEDPAVQVIPLTGRTFNSQSQEIIEQALTQANIPFQSIKKENNAFLIRFNDQSNQIKAKETLTQTIGNEYIVALNLAPKTPAWLEAIGASPMKLGLDLRGGVHFLMEVDVNSAIERRLEGILADIRTEFRQEKIRYRSLRRVEPASIRIDFNDLTTLNSALKMLQNRFQEFDFSSQANQGRNVIMAQMKPLSLQEIRNYTVEQTISTLRNRVNELGVAEAVVQRQGLNHIVVELPGIQDTARAKDILGKTATLEFHLFAKEESEKAVVGRAAPFGTKWVKDRDGQSFLLKKRVILTGDSITGAVVGTDDRSGRPAVHVRVGGAGLAIFKKATMENVGNLMGVVYIETKAINNEDNPEAQNTTETTESLISLATIQSALGSQFQVTGLSFQEAQDLALLLRAGALPATVTIVEERTVGPSLGQENIRLGVLSIQVGMALVVIAMLLYYSVFGLIANLALCFNVLFLIAILSLIGATLTLPGMAGIVLTVGMAVDANVLIFERIREELRNGMSPHSAIHSGFERALSTIVDANLTTLIVGIILFSVGSGPVKGFAVTLCIGIVTSMITAIYCTRAMVNLVYGRRDVKKLHVGI